MLDESQSHVLWRSAVPKFTLEETKTNEIYPLVYSHEEFETAI